MPDVDGDRAGVASAVLTAAAPDRMAIYDRRAHSSLHALGITLSHASGRYIETIDQLMAAAPAPIRNWTPRDMDTALYWLNHRTNTTAST